MGALGEDTERSEATSDPRRDGRWVLRGVLPADETSVLLRGQRLVIGRDDDVDVRLVHSRVSRQHAELYRQGPIYALRDLGSTNGSYVDGKRVEHCVIRPGTLLRIGDWLGLMETSRDEIQRPFGELVPGVFGGSELADALRTVEQVARSTLPLELVGETGTGKELFARAFHAFSGREGAFHAVNCAALPAALAKGNYSGTAAEPSRARSGLTWGNCGRRTGARYFSTKSRSSVSNYKRNSYERSSSRRCCRSARRSPSASILAWSWQRKSRSPSSWRRERSGPILRCA